MNTLQILSYAADVFKQRSDEFFVISAGLDNASSNIAGQSVDEYDFIRGMDAAVPGVFQKIDGMASHSYPNPGFSQSLLLPTDTRERPVLNTKAI
jgi:hypothetical protein